MTNFNFLKISKTKRIRYLKLHNKNATYIVFLHGFMSDLEGEKPKVLRKFCDKLKIGFLAVEYSGHGKSSGKFTDGNISKWSNQVKTVIKKKIKSKKFFLVGSSMGSWLSTLQFKYYKKQILGFIGIGSAPEFLQEVMWKKFSKKMKNKTIKDGIYNLKHGGYEYPINYQLIKDGRKNKVLNQKINTNIPITLFHGTKDEAIPVKFSRNLIKIFSSKNKKLVVVKNGDHSLFAFKYRKTILKELKNFIKSFS